MLLKENERKKKPPSKTKSKRNKAKASKLKRAQSMTMKERPWFLKKLSESLQRSSKAELVVESSESEGANIVPDVLVLSSLSSEDGEMPQPDRGLLERLAGQMVVLEEKHCGTVRFVGRLPDKDGTYLGVEVSARAKKDMPSEFNICPRAVWDGIEIFSLKGRKKAMFVPRTRWDEILCTESSIGQKSLQVGTRAVQVDTTRQHVEALGTVRYHGNVQEGRGLWVGLECENKIEGGHDGKVGGRRYFRCEGGRGRMCALENAWPVVSLTEMNLPDGSSSNSQEHKSPSKKTAGAYTGLSCMVCGTSASLECIKCCFIYCHGCFKESHTSVPKQRHVSRVLGRVRKCEECEVDLGTLRCVECEMVYCTACSASQHAKGARIRHNVAPLGARASQRLARKPASPPPLSRTPPRRSRHRRSRSLPPTPTPLPPHRKSSSESLSDSSAASSPSGSNSSRGNSSPSSRHPGTPSSALCTPLHTPARTPDTANTIATPDIVSDSEVSSPQSCATPRSATERTSPLPSAKAEFSPLSQAKKHTRRHRRSRSSSMSPGAGHPVKRTLDMGLYAQPHVGAAFPGFTLGNHAHVPQQSQALPPPGPGRRPRSFSASYAVPFVLHRAPPLPGFGGSGSASMGTNSLHGSQTSQNGGSYFGGSQNGGSYFGGSQNGGSYFGGCQNGGSQRGTYENADEISDASSVSSHHFYLKPHTTVFMEELAAASDSS